MGSATAPSSPSIMSFSRPTRRPQVIAYSLTVIMKPTTADARNRNPHADVSNNRESDNGHSRHGRFRAARRATRSRAGSQKPAGPGAGARGLRHRPRDHLRRLWLGTARRQTAGAGPRIARPGAGGA